MTVAAREQLEAHQAQLITRISAAARAADTRTLLSLNDELRQTASLLGRMEDLGVEARALLACASPESRTSAAPDLPIAAAVQVAGRAHGVQIRSDFLKRSSSIGFPLIHQRGAIYSTPSGGRTGIAVATERKPNRWFLGLGEDAFDAAVLLCKPDVGPVIDLCLPRSFIAQHKPYFSRSGGQIKFNVARRGGHTILKIPTRAAEAVDQFIGAIVGLDA